MSKVFSPKKDPTEQDLTQWQLILLKMHDFTTNMCRDALLFHLQRLSRAYCVAFGDDLMPGKKVVDIQNAVLKNDGKVCSDDYLKMVLAFLKLPQKLDLSWVKSAQQRVEDQYDIMFPICGDSNFSKILM